MEDELTHLCFSALVLRFNRLSVDAVDESSFAHLSNLQVLDIGTGNSDLPSRKDELDGEILEEEQDT